MPGSLPVDLLCFEHSELQDSGVLGFETVGFCSVSFSRQMNFGPKEASSRAVFLVSLCWHVATTATRTTVVRMMRRQRVATAMLIGVRP